MYGYFRPKVSGLTTKERRLFFGYYCRVCYCLRLLGGQTARFFTTHDMAVYSIVLNMSMKAPRPPYRKCERYLMRTVKLYEGDALGRRLANMSAIVFGEKFRDDELDGDAPAAKLLNMLFSGVIARARHEEPQMARIAREGTQRIDRMQREGADPFALFEAYGKMVCDLFECVSPLETRHRRLIAAIAAWTFYIDMLCDYDRDYQRRAYNGFHMEGIATLRACYAQRGAVFASAQARMEGALRAALFDAQDGSEEWIVLDKVISAALSSAPAFALATPGEKIALHARRFMQESFCWRFEGKNGAEL